MATIVDFAVRRNLGEGGGRNVEAGTRVDRAICDRRCPQRRASSVVGSSDRKLPGRIFFLDFDLLQHATGLADVLTIARLFNLERSIFTLGRSSENWTTRWISLQRDVPEQEVLDIESDLFVHALEEASQAS
ncbi:hypothetical protein [Bradyrhizobium sp. RT3a]|uniref:hypothetical protein n=1 Tax=unclassified Bradyrhizobium TaxID=2631580 RepID=UPI0033959B28